MGPRLLLVILVGCMLIGLALGALGRRSSLVARLVVAVEFLSRIARVVAQTALILLAINLIVGLLPAGAQQVFVSGVRFVGVLNIVLALWLALGLLVVREGVRLAGHDLRPRPFALRFPTDRLREVAVGRWMARRRDRRLAGGVVGLVVGEFFVDGELVLAGLIGVALGSLSAEIHLCRPEAGSVRVATISRRRLGDYVDARVAILLAVTALSLVASGLAWTAMGGWTVRRLLLLAISIGVFGLALSMMHLIAVRRPLAPLTHLRNTDELLRRLSIVHGIVTPLAPILLVVLGAAWAPPSSSSDPSLVGVLLIVLAIAAWLASGERLLARSLDQMPEH